MEEGRLLQLYAKRLLESVVEDGFTGRVGEIGQNDSVFFREPSRFTEAEVKTTGDDSGDY